KPKAETSRGFNHKSKNLLALKKALGLSAKQAKVPSSTSAKSRRNCKNLNLDPSTSSRTTMSAKVQSSSSSTNTTTRKHLCREFLKDLKTYTPQKSKFSIVDITRFPLKPLAKGSILNLFCPFRCSTSSQRTPAK